MKGKTELPALLRRVGEVVICCALAAGIGLARYGIEEILKFAIGR